MDKAMDITEKIGPTIVQIMDVKHDIELLTERLHGAQHPQLIDEYAMSLRQKQARLAELKAGLRELRQQELLHYEEQITQLDREIEISTELIDEHDLRELKKEMEQKVETIKKAIENEK